MSNFNKMFNSQTKTGRANVAKATYGTFALLYIIHRLRKRSKPSCPECGCQNCASGNESTAAATVEEQPKTETPCDPEVWKQAIYGDKSGENANGGEKETQEAKHVSYKIEKGVDLRIANMSNSEKKRKSSAGSDDIITALFY